MHGVVLESEIDLALPTTERETGPVITIRCGHVPLPTDWQFESRTRGLTGKPIYQVQHEGPSFVVAFPDRYVMQVTQHEILVDCHPSDAQVRPFVMAKPLSLCLELNGLVVLHAASCLIGDQLIALMGPSLAGKTSLSLALREYGHHIHTDDVIVLDPTDESFTVASGPIWSKVWPDTAERFVPDFYQSPLVTTATTKRMVARSRVHDAAKLAHLFALERTVDVDDVEIVPLAPAKALVSLVTMTHLAEIEVMLPNRAARMALLATLVDQIEVHQLRYPTGFDHLPKVVSLLDRYVSQRS